LARYAAVIPLARLFRGQKARGLPALIEVVEKTRSATGRAR